MIFKFRALSDSDDTFARDYELRYDSALLDFHNLICADLGFDPAEMASFFISDTEWGKAGEFTSLPIGLDEEDGPQPMESALLGNIVQKARQRLIYTFDPFSGRSLFIELTGTYKEEAGTEYPRVGFSAGPAPVQFDISGLTEEGSTFDEALGEFGSFEGDDSYDDDF